MFIKNWIRKISVTFFFFKFKNSFAETSFYPKRQLVERHFPEKAFITSALRSSTEKLSASFLL